jgi:NitT/TauT family transport system permease protein
LTTSLDKIGSAARETSPRHAEYLRALRNRAASVVGVQIVLLLAFFGVWQFVASWHFIDPFITSDPVAMIDKFVALLRDGSLGYHVLVTVSETIVGFAVGTILGIIVAAMLWWWDFFSDVAEPYVVVLNATPKIALGPVFIVWLGATVKAVIALSVSISLFVTILAVFSAFRQTDRDKLLLVRALGATKWQQFRKVVFPSAIPAIVATLKVNIGLSLIGTIVGEFLAASSGVGSLIVYGQNIFDMSLVMTCLVLLTAIAGVMYYAIVLFERHFVRWQRD